jgi:hypothetical protein
MAEAPASESPYRERFMRVYANLPLTERNMTVVVINEEPISWNMAYRELNQNTELGKKIGEKLAELKFI